MLNIRGMSTVENLLTGVNRFGHGLTSASAERERHRPETTLRQKPTKTQSARPPARGAESAAGGCWAGIDFHLRLPCVRECQELGILRSSFRSSIIISALPSTPTLFLSYDSQ
jgi:hypothetical protein